MLGIKSVYHKRKLCLFTVVSPGESPGLPVVPSSTHRAGLPSSHKSPEHPQPVSRSIFRPSESSLQFWFLSSTNQPTSTSPNPL